MKKTKSKKSAPREPRVIMLGPLKTGDRVTVQRMGGKKAGPAPVTGSLIAAVDAAIVVHFDQKPPFPVTVQPGKRDLNRGYTLLLKRCNWYAPENEKLEFTVDAVEPPPPAKENTEQKENDDERPQPTGP